MARTKNLTPPAAVMLCTCTHTGQDKLYGTGKRLFNGALKVNGQYGHRCTVCSRTQPLRGGHTEKGPELERPAGAKPPRNQAARKGK